MPPSPRCAVAAVRSESWIEHPETGKTVRLVTFLAGDSITGLTICMTSRTCGRLDTKLANSCLDYLNYKRLWGGRIAGRAGDLPSHPVRVGIDRRPNEARSRPDLASLRSETDWNLEINV
jgi:hypothetical protein